LHAVSPDWLEKKSISNNAIMNRNKNELFFNAKKEFERLRIQ